MGDGLLFDEEDSSDGVSLVSLTSKPATVSESLDVDNGVDKVLKDVDWSSRPIAMK